MSQNLLKARILDVLKVPRLASFATITLDGKPWTRYVMAVGDDNLVVRFATRLGARKVKHIANSPEVHLTCGVHDPAVMAPYLQMQGRAVLCRDDEERRRFWNPNLEPIFKGPDDPDYGVIVVTPYRIEYCAIGTEIPEVWTKP